MPNAICQQERQYSLYGWFTVVKLSVEERIRIMRDMICGQVRDVSSDYCRQ